MAENSRASATWQGGLHALKIGQGGEVQIRQGRDGIARQVQRPANRHHGEKTKGNLIRIDAQFTGNTNNSIWTPGTTYGNNHTEDSRQRRRKRDAGQT